MARIAVIDDSQATTDMLASILQGANHSVISYNNPESVEDKIALEQPQLIMLDIVMPERNGYEVLRALKRNRATKDIPVVLVTSKDKETDVRWGKRQGATHYITKPFEPQEILSVVQAMG